MVLTSTPLCVCLCVRTTKKTPPQSIEKQKPLAENIWKWLVSQHQTLCECSMQKSFLNCGLAVIWFASHIVSIEWCVHYGQTLDGRSYKYSTSNKSISSKLTEHYAVIILRSAIMSQKSIDLTKKSSWAYSIWFHWSIEMVWKDEPKSQHPKVSKKSDTPRPS